MAGSPRRGGALDVRIKRVYEPAADDDGTRVLVDRLWPRGIRREALRHDEWLRAISPSAALRAWFHHDQARWAEFIERFRAELATPDNQGRLARLRALAARGRLTLLYAAREERFNNAAALREVILARG